MLEYLGRKSLQSAILVSRTWAAEGICVLWQLPPVRALASIESDHRRQFYADHIHKLNFRDAKDCMQHAKFRCLEFPRLRSLEIHTSHPEGGNVETFVVTEACLEDLFGLLQSRCPQLQEIVV